MRLLAVIFALGLATPAAAASLSYTMAVTLTDVRYNGGEFVDDQGVAHDPFTYFYREPAIGTRGTADVAVEIADPKDPSRYLSEPFSCSVLGIFCGIGNGIPNVYYYEDFDHASGSGTFYQDDSFYRTSITLAPDGSGRMTVGREVDPLVFQTILFDIESYTYAEREAGPSPSPVPLPATAPMLLSVLAAGWALRTVRSEG